MNKSFQKSVLAFFVVLAFSRLFAVEPTITVTAQQRYPWNGKFDITYTVNGVDAVCQAQSMVASLKVFAVEQTAHVTNVAKTANVSGDLAVSDGTHKLVWDMDAQGVFNGLVSTNLEVFVSIETSRGVQLWKDGPYWAEWNVGATKPEEYGCYFCWGNSVGYKRNADNNGWISVKDETAVSFSESNCPTFGKNNSALQSLGYIDSSGNLAAAYDAATIQLGVPWRMPTIAEISALRKNCTTTWITTNGVKGRLVMGKDDYASKSIFLPAGGYGFSSGLYDLGTSVHLWSSSPSEYSGYAQGCSSNEDMDINTASGRRYEGCVVRPVR